MTTELNLREIERKAFTSIFEDGLWDMLFGLIVVGMSLFIYRPATGYSPLNILLMLVVFVVAYSLFFVGKKYIALPRMGQMRFGAIRKRKTISMVIILGVLILLQVGLVGVTALGWMDPEVSAKLNSYINERGSTLPVVAAIGSLMVGIPMIVIVYFLDFLRGYYIAIMMSLAVFLMIYINQPAYPILIGGLIFLPGLALFIRFLKTYPLQREEMPLE